MIVDCALPVVGVQGRIEGYISSLHITKHRRYINIHLLCNFSALAFLLVLGIDGLLFLLDEFGLFALQC